MVDRITPRTTAGRRAGGGRADGLGATRRPWSPSRSPSGCSAAPSRRAGPRGRRPAPRSSTTSTPTRRASCCCSTAGTRLLAYAGSARGHETIAEAMADGECRGWLDQWWDEARALRAAARRRPGCLPRGAASSGSPTPGSGTRSRRSPPTAPRSCRSGVLPVLRAERAAGRMPAGAVRILAAWIDHLRGIRRAGERRGCRPVPGTGGIRAGRDRPARARPGRRRRARRGRERARYVHLEPQPPPSRRTLGHTAPDRSPEEGRIHARVRRCDRSRDDQHAVHDLRSQGGVVGAHQLEHQQILPRAGWIEHDPSRSGGVPRTSSRSRWTPPASRPPTSPR